MIDISLNENEQKVCQLLATNRYNNNRNHEIIDAKIGPQSCQETDMNGVGAEFAFCKAANLYPDLGTIPGKYDARTTQGLRVDIKTTKYKTGKLLAVISKLEKDVDIYVLVIGTFPDYIIAGWTRASDLLKEERIIDLGYGPTYAMTQDKLRTDFNFPGQN